MAKKYEGTISLPSVIKPTGRQPLDERTVVDKLFDLTNITTFSNNTYVGMVVSVIEEKAQYMLIDNNFQDINNWVKQRGDDEINGLTKIISSDNEPGEVYQDDYIWLQETDDEIITDDNVALDLRSMQRAIAELTKIVQRHEYAFSNTMDCGRVSNNAREEMMNEAVPEVPEGYVDGTTPILLDEYNPNKSISQIIDYYYATKFSSGVEIKNGEWTDVQVSLDEENKYLWMYKKLVYNDETEKTVNPLLVDTYGSNKVIDKIISFYNVSADGVNYPSKTDEPYSETIPDLNEDNKYLWFFYKPEYVADENADKPSYDEGKTPNVKHLVIKSADTEQEIKDNLINLLNGELIWCEANNGLYIKSKNKLVKINGGNTGDDSDEDIDDIMSGITFIEDGVSSIDFISSKGSKYTMKVNDKGNLMVYSANLDVTENSEPTKSSGGTEQVGYVYLEKLYINAVYCGGLTSDEHSFNPCSHNFVELSNLTGKDINLKGLTLKYCDYGTDWVSLPLWGVIKNGSTFLIRGAQCSVINSNRTVINVDDYDMEWYVKNNDGSESLIKFNDEKAKFYLTYDTDKPLTVANPYDVTGGKVQLQYGYIDLVGLGSTDGSEKSAYNNIGTTSKLSSYLYKKYFSMDNVSQANKAIDKRNNANDWYYVDLTRNDIIPSVFENTPKASKYKKNLFYDKTKMKDGKPTIVTISFGIQATDSGSGATRCFNWVTKGYFDEYVWCRKEGETSWGEAHESYKNSNDDYYKYYNRITTELSDGEVVTTHKYILKGLEATIASGTTYEYICGQKNSDGTPNIDKCSEVRTFKVHSTQYIIDNGYRFIQTSDQQGFNWDEYQVWKYSAQAIYDEYVAGTGITPNFIINTGDMTQNGNRINEWLDYFEGHRPLNNFEEMATIGNNDLCPKKLYQLGNGGDASKMNFANMNLFFTFEMNPENMSVFTVNYNGRDTDLGYIPSIYSFIYGDTHFLCVNSEISDTTEKEVFGLVQPDGIIKPLVYDEVAKWCEKDYELFSGDCTWHIAYCHEMPFTIITNGLINQFCVANGKGEITENGDIERGGSRINTNIDNERKYWFSKFCQDKGFRLVMGGHKHTQTVSWPIKENINPVMKNVTMKPIIEVTLDDLTNNFNTDYLVEVKDNSDVNGQKFPSTWFNVSDGIKETTVDKVKSDYIKKIHLCTFDLVEKVTAPIYSMSQATGYKQTSNKELPSAYIPWLRYYYPCSNNGTDTANGKQKHPFFSVYDVNKDTITLRVNRIENIMESGKFNINKEGEQIKKGTRIPTIFTRPSYLDSDNDKTIIIKK